MQLPEVQNQRYAVNKPHHGHVEVGVILQTKNKSKEATVEKVLPCSFSFQNNNVSWEQS